MRAVLLCALLMGCSTTWTKSGATQADFERDRYECDIEVGRVVAADAFRRIDLKERCMRVRGWRAK